VLGVTVIIIFAVVSGRFLFVKVLYIRNETVSCFNI